MTETNLLRINATIGTGLLGVTLGLITVAVALGAPLYRIVGALEAQVAADAALPCECSTAEEGV